MATLIVFVLSQIDVMEQVYVLISTNCSSLQCSICYSMSHTKSPMFLNGMKVKIMITKCAVSENLEGDKKIEYLSSRFLWSGTSVGQQIA